MNDDEMKADYIDLINKAKDLEPNILAAAMVTKTREHQSESAKRAINRLNMSIFYGQVNPSGKYIKEKIFEALDALDYKKPVGYLSYNAERILKELYSDAEYCVPYNGIGGKTPENIASIAELKQNGMIEFWRGLFTEDGEVAGSGWCRSPKGNEYFDEYKLYA